MVEACSGLWAAMPATRIAQPIKVLKTGVEAISRGTYDGPLDVKTGDGEDLVAVHRMADRLQASHQSWSH